MLNTFLSFHGLINCYFGRLRVNDRDLECLQDLFQTHQTVSRKYSYIVYGINGRYFFKKYCLFFLVFLCCPIMCLYVLNSVL